MGMGMDMGTDMGTDMGMDMGMDMGTDMGITKRTSSAGLGTSDCSRYLKKLERRRGGGRDKE